MTEGSHVWGATPQRAHWLGEIIYSRAVTSDDGTALGTETDYAYGFSTDPLPDPRLMCPDGADVLEETLVHLPSQVSLRGQRHDAVPVREFRVWCENGDLIGVHATYGDAANELRTAVAADIARFGEQAAASGVLSTFGYSIQVIEDDQVITQDFANNHPGCPLGDAEITGWGR